MLHKGTVGKYRGAIMATQKWEITVPTGYTKPVVTATGENMGMDLTKTLPPMVNFIAWLDGILVTYRIPATINA